MRVDNFHGGTDSKIQINEPATGQQVVMDATIDFSVDITYTDHPYVDNGVGYFRVELSKLTTSGWEVVETKSKTLGNDDDDGDWSDTIVVSATMTEEVEQYQLALHCETQQTSAGTEVDLNAVVQAVQGLGVIGDFTLDFIPASIVYCPPGQDMTNSLTQSESYGTRFTIGRSSGFKTETGVQAKIDFLGIIGEGVGFSNSQSVTNQSTSGIEVSHFRTTVVTADNQRAIGRAYWGPLGDLFVILVNPSFETSKRADGSLFYAMKSIKQMIVVPAWKLLRPGDDPIAGAIPADVRRRLLELDPFIHNLDRFFPEDLGDDLSVAANPYADPSGGNRAELLGRWWLDTGSVLNYSEGESRQLFSTQTNEVKFESTVTINASAGINYDGIAASLGLSQSSTTSVGFQQSKETSAAASRTAACLLMHNQNERDLDGIDIFYDKIFSTFMFRRVRRKRRPREKEMVPVGALLGHIHGRDRAPLRGAEVVIRGREGEQRTSTSPTGEYTLVNLPPGKYTLEAGDQRRQVEITEDSSPDSPHVLDLTDVRRKLDLRAASVWEVQDALGIPSHVVQRIGGRLGKIGNASELAKVACVDRDTSDAWREQVQLQWPRKPRPSRKRKPSRKRPPSSGKRGA
jgi:hypothetical protein